MSCPGRACDEAGVALRTVLSQTLVWHSPQRPPEERKPEGAGSGQGGTRRWVDRLDRGLGSPPPGHPTRPVPVQSAQAHSSGAARVDAASAGPSGLDGNLIRQAGWRRAPSFPQRPGDASGSLLPGSRTRRPGLSPFPCSRPALSPRGRLSQPDRRRGGSRHLTGRRRAKVRAPAALPGPPQVLGRLASASREGCLCGRRRLPPLAPGWVWPTGSSWRTGRAGGSFPAHPVVLSRGPCLSGRPGSLTALPCAQGAGYGAPPPAPVGALTPAPPGAHLRPDCRWPPAHLSCSRTHSVTDIG